MKSVFLLACLIDFLLDTSSLIWPFKYKPKLQHPKTVNGPLSVNQDTIQVLL